MSITIQIQKAGTSDPEVLEIENEILIDELLRQVLDGQHEQFDLFAELSAEPYNRQHRANEAGIRHGDSLRCRHRPHEVRIHIDQEALQSPSVTTGNALYQLGHVPAGRQLYREVEGNREDTPIFRDGEIFELKQDEHFHSSDQPFKGYEIVVNTVAKVVFKRLLTFDEIVDLAFNPRPAGTDQEFTVLFRNAAGRRHQGTLAPGHAVKIKNGTIFDVTPTNRS